MRSAPPREDHPDPVRGYEKQKRQRNDTDRKRQQADVVRLERHAAARTWEAAVEIAPTELRIALRTSGCRKAHASCHRFFLQVATLANRNCRAQAACKVSTSSDSLGGTM
jgi:hypothetical protein